MKKLVLLLLLAASGYLYYSHAQRQHQGPVRVAEHSKIYMYSLTTCGYCKQKKEQLLDQGIRFIEYFIDEEPARREELDNKMRRAGLGAAGYGVPIFDVHGFMLPNNPSLATIREHTQLATARR